MYGKIKEHFRMSYKQLRITGYLKFKESITSPQGAEITIATMKPF
jgi:hypothetical protein